MTLKELDSFRKEQKEWNKEKCFFIAENKLGLDPQAER
jgi:hypothetical protein